MIRNDYKDGGFPISRRNPVVGVSQDGQVHVAYNRYDLKQMLGRNIISICGVWPGNKNSDVFPLDHICYRENLPVPPEQDKEIDSSPEIVVKVTKEQEFRGVAYYNVASGEKTLSTNPSVYEYLKKAPLSPRIITV